MSLQDEFFIVTGNNCNLNGQNLFLDILNQEKNKEVVIKLS
jgi:hypothetical protein